MGVMTFPQEPMGIELTAKGAGHSSAQQLAPWLGCCAQSEVIVTAVLGSFLVYFSSF